jgi:hypothetical protein
VEVVVCLLVGASIIQKALHHGLLVHSPLGHGRSDLGGACIHGLHGDVVNGPFVDRRYVLHVVRDALVDGNWCPPHLLCNLAQSGPVLGMQVTEPFQRSICDLDSLGRVGSLRGEPSHLGHGLLLHPPELLSMHRGLGGHGVAQGPLALAAPHHLGGHELHVGHARLGAVRRAAQLHLFELRVVLALLHCIVGLLHTPEL